MAIIETKDNRFKLYYRIMFGGRPVRVCLKAALIEESDGPQLIIGVTNMEIRADGGERYALALQRAHRCARQT